MSDYTYNSKAAKFSLNGIPYEDGLAETFIEFSRLSEMYVDAVGADGSVGRSKTNDNRMEAVITFMQNSIENKKIQDRVLADDLTPNGLPVGPFYYRDTISGDEIFAEKAWVKTRDTISRGREQSDQGWTFLLANAYVKFGDGAVL